MLTMQIKDEYSASRDMSLLRSRILMDGFQLMFDPQASRGCRLHDALSDQDYLDFYAFFASQPIGFNHPRLHEPGFQSELRVAALTKVANSDVYSRFYAEFVRTFDQLAALPGFTHYFFIDGGALAVENALKAAFDWKVRKNIAAGRGEIGHRVIHFRRAFHGRTGYTLSITDTADPRKTMYFPKFDWPRIDNPAIDFTLEEPRRTADVAAREQRAVEQIQQAIARWGADLAAVVIEPIQGEGGDNHFRGEFLARLRELCDRQDMLLIYDEVQTGVGITGKMWCCQHFDVYPDILCFGKKTQVCGIMANQRVDEVDSVFKVPSRINSTWGGNVADMVRSAQYLRIIRDEGLVECAARNGAYLLEGLRRLAARHPLVSAVRGRGLMCAFDLPDAAARDAVRKACIQRRMLILGCGERSIRFRPVLDVDPETIDAGLAVLDEALSAVAK